MATTITKPETDDTVECNNDDVNNNNSCCWRENYEKLKAYKETYGDTLKVPRRKYGMDQTLSTWVDEQRAEKTNGTLGPDRKRLLDQLDFVWDAKSAAREATWLHFYGKLKAYKETHGHTTVPPNYSADLSLGEWVENLHNKAGNRELREYQQQLLKEIGFTWSNTPEERLLERQRPRRRRHDDEEEDEPPPKAHQEEPPFVSTADQKWFEKYKQLLAYKETHNGNMRVPVLGVHKCLGRWVHNQRTNQRTGKLRKDRERLLEEIDFPWSVGCFEQQPAVTTDDDNDDDNDDDEQWWKRYRKLKSYVKKTDNNVKCRVKSRLGQWVQLQRTCHDQGTLRQDRKQLLDQIGFVWEDEDDDASSAAAYRPLVVVACKKKISTQDTTTTTHGGYSAEMQARWLESYAKLKAYKAVHGHAQVPLAYREDRPLGAWVGHQRKKNKTGKLKPVHKRLLDDIGFVWDARGVVAVGDGRKRKQNSKDKPISPSGKKRRQNCFLNKSLSLHNQNGTNNTDLVHHLLKQVGSSRDKGSSPVVASSANTTMAGGALDDSVEKTLSVQQDKKWNGEKELQSSSDSSVSSSGGDGSNNHDPKVDPELRVEECEDSDDDDDCCGETHKQNEPDTECSEQEEENKTLMDPLREHGDTECSEQQESKKSLLNLYFM